MERPSGDWLPLASVNPKNLPVAVYRGDTGVPLPFSGVGSTDVKIENATSTRSRRGHAIFDIEEGRCEELLCVVYVAATC